MMQNGKTLSMHSNAVFKGDYTHNGTLLKLHENSYTIGYSQLLTTDGTAQGKTKFGNGVFLDLSKKNNNVYTGTPTGTGAVPAFAGIMVREPAIASGYPAINDEVAGFQNGLLCREGYIVYKKCEVYLGSGSDFDDVEIFDYVYQNYCLFITATSGKAYFAPKATGYKSSSDLLVGRVVEINPDDRSVTVYITPAILSDTADIVGATPTIVVTTADISNTAIPFIVELGTEAVVKLAYKAHSATDYTDVEGTLTAVFDETDSKYKAKYTLTGLTKNTAYDIKAIAISACGAKTDTEENVSTTNV